MLEMANGAGDLVCIACGSKSAFHETDTSPFPFLRKNGFVLANIVTSSSLPEINREFFIGGHYVKASSVRAKRPSDSRVFLVLRDQPSLSGSPLIS
jgi:hypothetical protein